MSTRRSLNATVLTFGKTQSMVSACQAISPAGRNSSDFQGCFPLLMHALWDIPGGCCTSLVCMVWPDLASYVCAISLMVIKCLSAYFSRRSPWDFG